ncbi:hypothetical protein CVT25_015523 [Psilocybe cyanescens]|uniref:Uncharacterized protein n=1 Tax=Psilocybe cyanescens TaxID=93625 RepID=A0A409WIB4_PSICY|nr:hypothetical protein CVT25_015523 [Psilocybe cyanescens]
MPPKLFDGQTQNQGVLRQQMNHNLMARRGIAEVVDETQTQEETQQFDKAEKRPAPQDGMHNANLIRPNKKIKMSLAVGVDLAE